MLSRPRYSRDPAIVELRLNPAFVATAPPFPSLLLETVHDGEVVPTGLCATSPERARLRRTVARAFYPERDWGADLVADELARALGHQGYHRVRIARSLLDHGRFAGQGSPADLHVERRALSPAVGALFTERRKRSLLRGTYDPVWSATRERLAALLTQRLATPGPPPVRIGIHTYDPEAGGRARPELSLLTLPNSCKSRGHLAPELYDPLVPQAVAVCSADPALRDGLALEISRRGHSVTHNDPYTLPDGSLEVRAQVWYYLSYLRAHYQAARPAMPEAATELLWGILTDVSLERHPTCSFPCLYLSSRDPEHPLGSHYEAAAELYDDLTAYAAREGIASRYLASSARLSTLVLEVRKDLVWLFDRRGLPRGPRVTEAHRIATALAAGIRSFLAS